MFQFLGLDFLSGPDALNPAPSAVDNITYTEISNAIFDHLNLSRDTSEFGNTTIPTQWTYDTILNATFNGTLNAGNLEYSIRQLDGIKIKRRLKPDIGEAYDAKDPRYRWLTLSFVKIDKVEDLNFAFNDFLNAWGVEYEYAFVPVVRGTEGKYIVDSIKSKFNGVFIGDSEQAFKFLYDVSYGSNLRKQQTGTFAPMGRQYPIVVANGISSYESGSVTGTVLNDSFEKDGKLDRLATVRKKNQIKDFLTNKRPKVLKDWNGNIWLVMVTEDVPVEYREGSGMGIPNVSFNWTEIGDVTNQEDLYDAGLVDTLE